MPREPLVRRPRGNAPQEQPAAGNSPTTPSQEIRRRGPWPQGQASTNPSLFSPPSQQTSLSRSDLGIFMHPGLTDACSLAHVFRNIAVQLYVGQRADVRWEQEDGKYAVSCPTYLADVGHFRGRHLQPYVTMTWRVEDKQADPLERSRIMLVTTDNSEVLSDKYLNAFCDPQVSVVLVLSPECERVLVEAGVPQEKIRLLPLGVDGTVYRPDGPTAEAHGVPGPQWLSDATPENGAFTFLCAGYLQPRKGVRETVEAFGKAFVGRTDVALVLKNVPEHWSQFEKDEIHRLMNGKPDFPPVGIINEVLSKYQVAALLRSVDCFVNAHHREGFGLMPLQAMACGTPCLVTDYHGPTQYARGNNSYLLPVKEMGLAGDTSWKRKVPWAMYEVSALVDLMQQAAAGKRRNAIVKAGLEEAAKWTWARTVQNIVEIVESEIGHLRKRPLKWRSPKATCSVVMPVRNASAKLATTLRTLHECHPPDEVLVYDDASDAVEGGAIEEICETYRGVQLLQGVRGQRQIGCHGARALMFEQARGEFIASIDADMDFTETAEDWVEKLIALWRERGHGIMHPLLHYPQFHKEHAGLVHSAGSYVVDTVQTFQHRYTKQIVETEGVERPVEVAVCCGAFQFFHHTLLDQVYQDGAYWPAYYGDADFAYRARAVGRPVWYCPEVVVGHDANSWGLTEEGRRLANWGETAQRFRERWADMVEEDLLRQDETGALRW